MISGRATISGLVTVGVPAFSMGLLADGSTRYTPENYTTFTPPAKGGTYVDSRFGVTVKRMGDGQTDFGATSTGATRHDLHSTNACNYTEEYLLLLDGAGDHFVVSVANPSTVIRDRTATDINNNEEPKWGGRTNEIFYKQLNVLKKYNVDTNTHSTVHTFTGYADISLGEGEGDWSEDGDYLPIVGRAGGTGITWSEDVFLYKLSTDEIGPVLRISEIIVATISGVSGNDITLGTYQYGYTGSAFVTAGKGSRIKIFSPAMAVRGTDGYALITAKPSANVCTIGAGLPAGTATNDLVGFVKHFDQVHVTPDVRVIVGYDVANSTNNQAYDAVGSQIYTRNMERVTMDANTIQALFHCDICRDTNGSEIMIQEADSDFTPATALGGGVQKQDLYTGTKTSLINMGYFTSKHPSVPSSGIYPWVVSGNLDSDTTDGVGVDGRTATLPSPGSGLAADWDTQDTKRWRYEFINEITLAKLDGTERRHLAHHRGRFEVGPYWGASIRCQFTQRGTYVVFDSNYAQIPTGVVLDDYSDTYLIQLKAVNADWTAPTFSSISSGTPGETTATITYDTSKAGTTQLEYGTTTFYGDGCTTFDPDLETSHTINLTGLTADTTYHYRLKCRDSAGNIGLSADQTFDTAAGADMAIIGGYVGGSAVPASTTRWAIPFIDTLSTGEIFITTPKAITTSRMEIRTSGAQGAGGSIVYTLRKNASDQALAVTIAAGSAAGTYGTDAAIAFAIGDRLSVKIINNDAGASSGGIESIMIGYS